MKAVEKILGGGWQYPQKKSVSRLMISVTEKMEKIKLRHCQKLLRHKILLVTTVEPKIKEAFMR